MAQGKRMPTTDDLVSMWHASGLKQKIIFTFLMIAAFRLGAQLPLFGVNNEAFRQIAQGNNIIGFLDLFSGGALGNVSIFALGIGPYITASIIIQLMVCNYSASGKITERRWRSRQKKIGAIYKIFYLYSGVLPIFCIYALHEAFADSYHAER